MIRGKQWGFTIWAVFMGLLGILFPPTGDIYRYYLAYRTISDVSWSNFIFYLSFRNDYLLFTLEFLLAKLGFQFDYYKFIYNFITYFILGKLYISIIKVHGDRMTKKLKCFFLFTILTFSISAYLFRFDFSKILFIYGGYIIFFENKERGWWCIVIACLNHLSMVLLAVILICARLRLFSFSKFGLIILSGICILLDANIASRLLSFMPISVIDHYSIYLDGYWAGEFLKDHSFLFKLQRYFTIGITYVGLIIYILIYKNRHIKEENFVNGLFVITSLSVPFVTIFYRFSTILFLAIKLYFLRTYNFTRKSYNCLCLLLVLTIFSNMMGVWSSRRQLGISEIEKIILPMPYILSFSYTESWISNNVFENGDFKHN